MEKNDENELIDKFGEVIDKFLLESDIRMMIRLPEGSMDPEIKSSFDDIGFDRNVMNLYILLHAIANVVANLIKADFLDPERAEDMLDGIFDMAKKEILKEAADDSK